MGDVLVTGGKLSDGQITELDVELHRIGPRKIDRETALSWMKDGHSLVPMLKNKRLTALQLVEVGDATFIRPDNVSEAEDLLPVLG